MAGSTTVSMPLVFIALLAAAAGLLPTSLAFWCPHSRGISIQSYSSLSPFGSIPVTRNKLPNIPSTVSPTPVLLSARGDGISSAHDNQPPPRKEATIRLEESGKEATLISRTLQVFPNNNNSNNNTVTVWEWKNSAKVVNAYWEAQGQMLATAGMGDRRKPLLDPFGLVLWPGSVLAARELYHHAPHAVANQTVVVLGAGVGVETQAAAMLGPKQVIATDIHPTTLQQLEYGVARNDRIPSTTQVTTQLLDLFLTRKEQPVPACDLLVVADVLYSEQLASQVCRRCAEALSANPNLKILVTDSQRFVPTFLEELNQALARAVVPPPPEASWKVETMKQFEGSGVIIDEDQTYDVTVQSLWIGL